MIRKVLRQISSDKNYSYVLIGLVFSSAFAFFNNLILARMLKPESYGLFFSILAIAMLFGNLSVSGLPMYLQELITKKVIDKRKSQDGNILLAIIFFFTFLFFFSYFLWVFYGPNQLSNEIIFIILSLLIIFQPFIEVSKSILQINSKFQKLSYLNLIINFNRFIFLLTLFLFFKNNINLELISFIFILGSVPAFFYSIKILNNFFSFNLINFFDKNFYSRIKKIFFDLRYFFTGNAFYFIYFSIDIIIIKYLLSDFDAGIFFAAFSIVLGLQIINEATVRTYSFQYFKKSEKDKNIIKNFLNKNIRFLMYISLPISLIIFLFSEHLISIFYGENYLKSSELLKILIFIMPIKLITTNYGLVLITFKKSLYNFLSLVLITIIKIPTMIISIYNFDLLGAIFGLLFLEILYCFILRYFVNCRLYNEKQ